MDRTIKYIALCPRTGSHLREATPDEVTAYHAGQKDGRYQAGKVLWSHNVLLGGVVITADTGPGEWFGGAGF